MKKIELFIINDASQKITIENISELNVGFRFKRDEDGHEMIQVISQSRMFDLLDKELKELAGWEPL